MLNKKNIIIIMSLKNKKNDKKIKIKISKILFNIINNFDDIYKLIKIKFLYL